MAGSASGALDLLVDSCDQVVPLLRSPELARSWDEPSALAGWTNAGLAGHLARSAFNLHRAWESAHGAQPALDVVGYYTASDPDPADSPIGRRIRELGDAEAAQGPEALADRFAASVAAIRRAAPPGNAAVELFGRTVSVADCAKACLLELVVHSDDLAVSTGALPPRFSAESVDLVVGALVRISLRRHGSVAVVRTLARAERAPTTGISAF